MRKARSLDLETSATPRGRWRRPILTLLLTLALAPLAYESTARCVANWRSMLGPDVRVETPLLDVLESAVHRTFSALEYQVAEFLSETPWKPSVVIACGIGLAVLASAPLRKIF